MSRVLVIGDTHAPCMLDEYVDFLRSVRRKYKTDMTVHIGDLVDWASISYHEKSHALKNGEGEYRDALKQVSKLYKAFPECTLLTGNHDDLPNRQAITANLPDCVITDYKELWKIPNWEVVPRYGIKIIDGVLYQHGDRGKGGQMAALKNCMAEFRSVVQGHLHAQSGLWYYANHKKTDEGGRVFGMQVGCGVDHSRAAMDYGLKFNAKPIVSCGVVLDGLVPHVIPMEL